MCTKQLEINNWNMLDGVHINRGDITYMIEVVNDPMSIGNMKTIAQVIYLSRICSSMGEHNKIISINTLLIDTKLILQLLNEFGFEIIIK